MHTEKVKRKRTCGFMRLKSLNAIRQYSLRELVGHSSIVKENNSNKCIGKAKAGWRRHDIKAMINQYTLQLYKC